MDLRNVVSLRFLYAFRLVIELEPFPPFIPLGETTVTTNLCESLNLEISIYSV